MPDIFPEFSRFRDTPTPEILVGAEREAMFVTGFPHEVKYLGVLWRRVPP